MSDALSFQNLPPAQRGLLDILDSARKPDGFCLLTVDMENAALFLAQKSAQWNLKLSFIDLILRALALACAPHREYYALYSGYRKYESKTLSIGCLVAANTPTAPIILFPDAPHLTIPQICELRQKLTREALEKEAERLRELESKVRFLPDKIRRALIARFVENPRTRHELAGNVQLSAIDLPHLEWMMPNHVGGALVVGMGGIKKRPMVVGDQIQARLCAHFTFIIDQRAIHPVKALRAARTFVRLLENPEKLLEKSTEEST